MAEPQPELSEAERRYRILRSSVSDYHYHVRVARGQILEKCHEPTCAVITGYQPEEYAADPELSISIIEMDDRPLVERQTAELLKGREPPPVEYRLRRKDGQLRWIHKTVVPYRDAQGEVIAYDSLLSDVTESKLAEETLRLSEERYRLLFEDDLTGDYLAAPDGTILLCNHAFVEIFGFENRESALRSNLTDLYLDPLSWPRFIELIAINKTLERYERTVRRSDGTVRHVIETVLGVFDAQGTILRIKGYVYDDTHSKLATARMQRRNAELEEVVAQRTQALRHKHEHLEAIWNSAFDAIITIDAQGIIETANRAAERMFGYTRNELIGRNVSMLMPSPFREEHDESLRKFHVTGQARILDTPRELIALRRDGTTFPIDLSVTQVDHSPFFTGVIRDISERRELQRHVLENAAQEQRRIGLELHDGIGQELTGLSLMAGTLRQLLIEVPRGASSGNAVRQLDEEGYQRLVCLVDRLDRNLTEADRHLHQLARGIMPVQVDAEALSSALAEFAASVQTPAGPCRFECPHPALTVSNTTATHLYRIAQEAVNNALKHSQADEIGISLTQQDDRIVLEVRDNGIGVETIDSRMASARKPRGMGLRTMQYRAGLIGGELQIERRPSGGTLVRCTLRKGGDSD